MKKIYALVIAATASLFGLEAMAQAPYCTPVTNFGCSFGDQITSFSTTGGSTNITNNGTTCSGGNYGDFTSMVVTIVPNGTFSFSVQAGPTFSQGEKIWIDWNHDDDFDDAGEDVWTSTTWTTAVQTGSITAPVGALTGPTRMRVRCSYNSLPTDPCANQTYGEVEDYTVEVLSPPANDAGIAGLLNPTLPTCDLDSVDVTVIVTSSGTNNLTSCDINWTVNGGSTSTFSYTGNIAQGGLDTVIITNASFTNGDDVVIWTEDPNNVQDSLDANDTVSITLATGLAGIYQIPADYVDFASAAADLAAFGVCDSVVFNVATGTYNEQIEIMDILGVSQNATITFQGATGNPGDVSLEFDPSGTFSNDGVVKLSGTKWITFQDMTIDNTSNSTSYGRVVLLDEGVAHVNIDNCIVNGSNGNTTSTNNVVIDGYQITMEDINITNSHISNGSYAVRLYGDFNDHNNHFNISNNVVDSFYFYGIYNYYNDSTVIVGNDISTDAPYTGSIYGIRIWDCDKQLDITENTVYNVDGAEMNTGIYVYNCDGSLNNRLNITNNCVTVGNIGDNDFAYGIYMFNTGLADVMNNTATNLNTSGTGYGHYVGSGGLIREYNNSFVNYGTGTARYVTSTYSMTESENNNYYSAGANVLFLNGNYATVEDFGNATGFDQQSVSTDPAFLDTIACVTCNDTMDAGGTVVTGVDLDINGEVRSQTTPDIGAVEYIAAGSFSLGADDTVCGDEVIIEAGPAQSVSWNVDGNVASTPTYTLSASGQPQVFNVSVNILTSFCGPASDNAVITLVPAASLDSMEHICADQTTTLNPGGGNNATYVWSNGMLTPTIDVDAPGTFTVTKSEMGCESTSTIAVTQSDAVEIADVEPCEDDAPIAIDGSINDGISYAWSGGDAPTSAMNNFNQSDIYSVTATDVFGCVSVDTFSVTIVGSPIAQITYTSSGGFGVFFSSGSSQQLSSNTTYNWTFDGTATSTMANPYYLFPFSGGSVTYPVTLEIDNGCGVDIQTLDIVLDPLSVKELASGEKVTVFPNPASSVLNVSKESAWKDAEFKLIDIAGRVVLARTITDANEIVTIDLNGVTNGTYTLNILQDGSTTTLPVIVQ